MIDFAGKTALVTGASRGIGAATAIRLAEYGAAVVLAARSKADIEAVASRIRDAGGTAEALTCDVCVFDQVNALVQHCVDHHGGLDILINNAGLIEPIAHLADSDPDEWARVADVNYKGVYHGMRAALPVMLERGSGTIVNVSSGAAVSALEGWSHYCSSKAAVLSLTRCGHKEYGDRDIRIVGLSPGTVATGMQTAIRQSGINPVSQLSPDDHIPAEAAAEGVCFLCTDGGDAHAGTDFSLRSDEGRRVIGLN